MTSLAVKYSVFGLIGYGIMEGLCSYIVPEWMRRFSLCYKEAIDCLHNSSEAMTQLGEPVKEGRINFSNKNENDANENFSWFTIPLKGSKTNGTLRYFIGSDIKTGKMFKTVRVELRLNDLPNKILLLKKSSEL